MTNEEAIKILERYEPMEWGDDQVAFEMAIEALKEQPVRYRDCISRADAIDRVGHWIDDKATDDAQARAVAIINDLRYLPSAILQPIAQPETTDCTTDLISRQAAVDVLIEGQDGSGHTYELIGELIDKVNALPSADRPKEMAELKKVRRGEWAETIAYTCPECGTELMKPDRPTGEWIPVSERLPEEYDQYLCYCEGGECYVYWLDNKPWAGRIVEEEKIIAWQPLPEPYKGGDTE